MILVHVVLVKNTRTVMGSKTMDVTVKLAENEKEISDGKIIRYQVFQVEQNIDSKEDFDGKDNDSDHIVAYYNGKHIGTLRIRYIDNKTAKIERLAVLPNFRKGGTATKIMKFTLDYLLKKGLKSIILDSQEYIKGFYEKLGFIQYSEVFEEVGIPHVKMMKSIN